MILDSACLAGVNCRYDGQNKEKNEILELIKKGEAIAVCPEQLGGLPTPRPPAEIQGDKVLTIDGHDVTFNYNTGALEALKLAELYNCDEAWLKSKSPMCGHGEIYDGNFKGKTTQGEGVLAKLLIAKGIKVRSID